jgi:hypothetical protein
MRVRAGSICDLVWNDANNNGVFDQGVELGLGGVRMRLYRDGGDTIVGSTDDVQIGPEQLTNPAGLYRFIDLAPGKYYVKAATYNGFIYSGGTPIALDNQINNDNNALLPGGPGTPWFSPLITLQPGTESVNDGDTNPDTECTVDFGLYAGGIIGDLVWRDINCNSLREATEPGVAGVSVSIFKTTDSAIGGGDDVLIETTTTNSSGNYSHGALRPGNYYVRLTPPASYPVASPSASGDNGINDDNNGSQASAGQPIYGPVVTYTPAGEPGSSGTSNTENTIDFGLCEAGMSVGDRVWIDANGNGLCEPTESGAANITLQIVRSTDSTVGNGDDVVVSSTQSGPDGRYLFAGLADGYHYVKIPNPPAVFAETTVNVVTQDNGVNNDNNGAQPGGAGTAIFSPMISLTTGGEPGINGTTSLEDTIDFGLKPCPSTPGVALSNGAVYKNVASALIDPGVSMQGAYPAHGMIVGASLRQQPDGSLVKKSWQEPGCLTSVSLSTPLSSAGDAFAVWDTYAGVVPDALPLTNLGSKAQVGAKAWTPNWDANGTTGYEFTWTITPSSFVRTSGLYWEANNPDGSPWDFVVLVDGVQVGNTSAAITQQPVTTVGSATTSALSYFFVDTSLTSLWQPGSTHTVTLRRIGASFAINDLALLGCCTQPMSIGNLVWSDEDNNGIRNVAEEGLAGAQVRLFAAGADGVIGGSVADVQIAAQTTGPTGAYRFNNLLPGAYYVKVTPPATHTKTAGVAVQVDNQIDNDNNGAQSILGGDLTSMVVNLIANTESITDGDTDANTEHTVDFGVWPGFRVGNLVWHDEDRDGLKDSSESGVDGAKLELMDLGVDGAVGGLGLNADTVVTSTVSAGGGAYTLRT